MSQKHIIVTSKSENNEQECHNLARNSGETACVALVLYKL